jgi:hypothetical protein
MSTVAVQLGFQDEPACAEYCPKLTYTQRLIGFVSSFCVGWIISWIGSLVLLGGFSTENVRTFVALYVVGQIISLLATGFLTGPRNQCVKMFDKTRRFSTIFFLTMIAVVFAVAITGQNIGIVFAMLFIELCAMIWYTASFIPFGRQIILNFLRSTCCGPCFKGYDWCAEKCGKIKKSAQEATGTAPKKQGLFSSGSSKQANKQSSKSWFGSSEPQKQESSSSWFGSSSSQQPEPPAEKGGLFSAFSSRA